MKRKSYRGWRPVVGALAIGVIAFGLSLQGAPAGDDADRPLERVEVQPTVGVTPEEGVLAPVAAARTAATCEGCGSGVSEPAATLHLEETGMREARVIGAVPVAGMAFAPRGTGGPRGIGDDCTCDDDCYDIPVENHGCRVPQCVTDEDTGARTCQMENTAVYAMCDLDELYCTYDWCVYQNPLDPESDMICEAQYNGGGTALSPCPKECEGGVRDGLWCEDGTNCPGGTCDPKDDVCCDEDNDWCYQVAAGAGCESDPLGRCCTDDSPADGYPENCNFTTEVGCTSGLWVRVSDPDAQCDSNPEPFGCPEYSAGVAPKDDPDGTDLGPVVPSPKECALTGDRCEDTEDDCHKLCSHPPNQICLDDDDCEGVANLCNWVLNACTDVPNDCHGVAPMPPDAEYFVELGDDYTMANGQHLRLTEFRFRGGVENPGERLFFWFFDNQDPPKFVTGFYITLGRAGVYDWTVEMDCWPDCKVAQGETPTDPPYVVPPEGWVVMRSSWAFPANGHWVSTNAEDVPAGTGNNHALLWWKGTNDATATRGDYPGLVDDLMTFELVGEALGGPEKHPPEGACCADDGGCTDELRWDCGHCVYSGDPCSRDRDCGIDDECTFISWQGPRVHAELSFMVCRGGVDDGLACVDDSECDSGDCRMQGRLCDDKRCSETGEACTGEGSGDCPVLDPPQMCWGPCDAGGCCVEGAGCQVLERLDCHDPDHPTVPGNDEWLGYGTGCVPNCCLQPPTGADCACDTDYRECYDTVAAEYTGQACEVTADCDGDDDVCQDRDCTGPTFFQSTTMGFGDPSDYFTFSGDSSTAEFTPDQGDDCSLDSDDLGWYEGFILVDDTPGDPADNCWLVTVDYCCNEPIKTPTWIVMMNDCPCGTGGAAWVTMDTDVYGDPRGGYGVACNAEHCCDDENYSASYTLPAGTYTWQMYGDLTCEDSLQNCHTDDDCPAGVQCVTELGPYIGHFTVAPCPLAACCWDVCVGGVNDGDFCARATEETDCGAVGLCQNVCEVTNRLRCEGDGNGHWLGAGAVNQPVPVCALPGGGTPCDTGACCVGPADCEDGSGFDNEVGCEAAGTSYVYHGGVTCDDEPCPVCAFYDAQHCHADHPDGYIIPIDEAFGLRGADDFVATGGTLITDICWTAGYYAPGAGECADRPPVDDWHVAFYTDDNGLPGTLIDPPGRQSVVIDGKGQRGGTSRLWDYAGHLENPVTVAVGPCYWMELSGMGDGICVVYWAEGLANEHCVRDMDDSYGPEDTNNYDYRFCLDVGMAADDCGPILGACCLCPDPPDPVEGECIAPGEGGYTGLQRECVEDLGGNWVVGSNCDPNPCPGTPGNDDCPNAVAVTGLATGVPPVSTGPQLYPVDNNCATDDGPDHTDCLSNGGDLTYDVWYAYTAECNGTLTVSSCPLDPADPDSEPLVGFDQMIAVYGTGACELVDQETTELVCGDDDCGIGGGPSEVEVAAVVLDQEFLVRVGSWEDGDSFSRGEGDVRFEMECDVEPTINPPALCEDYPNNFLMNRCYCFMPENDPPAVAAFHVTLDGLDPPDCFENGPCVDGGSWSWWVTKPVCTDKDGNDTGAVPGVDSCVYPNVWRAQLSDDPADAWLGSGWPVDEPIFVCDCEVVPNTTSCYQMQACTLPDVGTCVGDIVDYYTQVFPGGGKCWGDCVGAWDTINEVWTAPNGVINMDDIMAAVFGFQSAPNAPHRLWVEVAPVGPDMVLNFTDILFLVSCFKGNPYPFSCPEDCLAYDGPGPCEP